MRGVVLTKQGFEWENLGVLDRWSRMGDGRLQEVVAHEG